jgi:hypothetical protein
MPSDDCRVCSFPRPVPRRNWRFDLNRRIRIHTYQLAGRDIRHNSIMVLRMGNEAIKSLTDVHRAAALLAEWDAMMAEVYEYVAMDRARRQAAKVSEQC